MQLLVEKLKWKAKVHKLIRGQVFDQDIEENKKYNDKLQLVIKMCDEHLQMGLYISQALDLCFESLLALGPYMEFKIINFILFSTKRLSLLFVWRFVP